VLVTRWGGYSEQVGEASFVTGGAGGNNCTFFVLCFLVPLAPNFSHLVPNLVVNKTFFL